MHYHVFYETVYMHTQINQHRVPVKHVVA